MNKRVCPAVQYSTSLTRQLEGSQITQVCSVDATSTEDIHNIVYQGSSVPLSGRWNIPSALELGPGSCRDVEQPSIVVVISTVRAAKSTEQCNEGKETLGKGERT
jgi:hypothetical protein